MRQFLWFSLIFALVTAGCDTPRKESSGNPELASKESRMSDSDLEKAVRAKLEGDEQLKQANLDVDADADKNEITLSGSVPSAEMRTKAVELAKSVQSGLTVNDKIEIKPTA